MECTNCSAPVQPTWRHCEACGARVAIAAREPAAEPDVAIASNGDRPPDGETEVVEDEPTVIAPLPPPPSSPGPEQESSRRTRALRAALVGVPVLLVIGVLAFLAFTWRADLIETESQLAATLEELQATSEELAGVEAELEETVVTLETTEADLASTEVVLAEVSAERDGLETDLSAAEADVERLEDALADTQGDLQAQQQRTVLQAGQINVLRTCLGGVVDALYWVSYGYWSLAEQSLNSVSASCNQAAALF